MKKYKIIILLMLIAFNFIQCTKEQKNPAPEILSISPSSKVSHLPEFTLTVRGSNFINESVIVFDGKEKVTTYISDTELSCPISPDDTTIDLVQNSRLNKRSQSAKDLSVLVRTPAPGGGDSNSSYFTIKENFTFESPVRLFQSITNGWIGPLIIDKNDKLHMSISEIRLKKYYIFLKNYLSTSEDKGESWNEPEAVTDEVNFSAWNLMVDDQGNSHVLYNDRLDNSYQIYYKKKNRKKQSWSAPVRISSNDKSVYYNFLDHRAALAGDKIIAFWTVLTRSYKQFLVFSFSGDNGNSWTEPVRLKDFGFVIWADSLITKNGTLFLAFARLTFKGIYQFLIDIYGTRSTDNGATWSDPVMISNGAGRSFVPKVLYNGSSEEIKVVWSYKKTGQIIYNDTPASFMTHIRESRTRSGRVRKMENKKSSRNIITDPSFHLQLSSSKDGGLNWTPPLIILDYNIDYDYFFVENYDIAIDPAGNLNLITSESGIFGIVHNKDGSADSQIIPNFTRSTDGGLNWTEPITLTTIPDMIAEYLSVDSEGNVYILLNNYNITREHFLVDPFMSRSIKEN